MYVDLINITSPITVPYTVYLLQELCQSSECLKSSFKFLFSKMNVANFATFVVLMRHMLLQRSPASASIKLANNHCAAVLIPLKWDLYTPLTTRKKKKKKWLLPNVGVTIFYFQLIRVIKFPSTSNSMYCGLSFASSPGYLP